MNIIIPAVAFGVWYLWDKKSQGDALQKCEVQKFKLGKITIGLQETTLPVELTVFNPNNRSVYVDYFRGNVIRAGIKAGDFTFNTGKTVELARRSATPLTFTVRIPTIGALRNLIDIFKNLLAAKPVDTIFTIDGYLSISGLQVPVRYSWDAKTNSLINTSAVKGISGVGSFQEESVLWIRSGEGKHKAGATLDGKRISLDAAKKKITSGEYTRRAHFNGSTGLNVMYVKPINKIGKPYAKYEFESNDQMNDHFQKGCKQQVPAFSKN